MIYSPFSGAACGPLRFTTYPLGYLDNRRVPWPHSRPGIVILSAAKNLRSEESP